MPDKLTISINDNTARESPSQMSIWTQDALSAVQAAEIRDAVDDLTIGIIGATRYKTDTLISAGSTAKPTSQLAQRETKFKVFFTDNVTGVGGSFSIPCADLLQMPASTEAVDITTGVGLALASAINSYGRSNIGNPVTVTAILW